MTPIFKTPIAIVANGTLGDKDLLAKKLARYRTIIAVDGGLKNCHLAGVTPHFIIGDMDSASPEIQKTYRHIAKKIFPIEKNQTDLELAVEEVISQNIARAVIFCALEMRIDHSLYNLYLLSRYREMLTIHSDYETLFVVQGEQTIYTHPGQTVSLISLGAPAKQVTTNGLKWDIQNATIDRRFMSISNVCLNDSFTIEIGEGELLCCLVK
jgi:thiamine pyrophosphokinase